MADPHSEGTRLRPIDLQTDCFIFVMKRGHDHETFWHFAFQPNLTTKRLGRWKMTKNNGSRERCQAKNGPYGHYVNYLPDKERQENG